LYALAVTTRLEHTALANAVFSTYTIAAPLAISLLSSYGSISFGSLPMILLALCETILWVAHSLFACQLCVSRDFQLNRSPQLFRIAGYPIAFFVASLEFLPTSTRALLTLVIVSLASSGYAMAKFLSFEYADAYVDYIALAISVGRVLTYLLTLLGMLVVGKFLVLLAMAVVAVLTISRI